MTERKTIALDLDGVVHSYTSGWKGATELPDPPVPGAFEFIQTALEHFDVAIFSTRCNEEGVAIKDVHVAIWEWFEAHGMTLSVIDNPDFYIATRKPKAIVYIDDRGFRFEGT